MIKNKVIVVLLVLCTFFSMVLVKAFIVQIYDRSTLIEKSKKQIFRESKVFSHRGNIYDRNGSPLAINIQTYSLFTIPKNVRGGSESYRKLSQIVPNLSYKKILKKIKNRKRYTWLARKISLSDEQVSAIHELGKNGGIYIEPVPKRFYPNHELLSQSLGFVGVDNVGLSGLEYEFNNHLKGKPRITKYLLDAKGRPIKFESVDVSGEAKDLYLTIDKELQAVAEKHLKEAIIESKSNLGGIGVMDAETGEILAIANYPTFDPNDLKKSKTKDRKLSFVIDPIEPGSIFKTLTVASALENKIARPDTNYYCEQGKLKIDNHIINEAESAKKYEWLSVNEIIRYSSNIGTTKIAFDLTFPKLKRTLLDFNIGQKTGIEIPGESRGIFYSENNISPLQLSNMSFGQGIATTGIQILAAYSAIVNGGEYIQPTIVKDEFNYRKRRRVISKQTSKELINMLVQAVENGTGGRARIPHFKIAGKTSTAQRPDASGSYEGYIPGFIGFPMNVDNKFVIYVYLDNPKSKHYYGNAVAAPVFKKVSQYLLYKNKEIKRIVAGTTVNEKSSMDWLNVKQSSLNRFKKGRVPNFEGLDKKSVKEIGKRLELRLVERGIGVVSKQTPSAGTKIDKNTVVRIRYSPPAYE